MHAPDIKFTMVLSLHCLRTFGDRAFVALYRRITTCVTDSLGDDQVSRRVDNARL